MVHGKELEGICRKNAQNAQKKALLQDWDLKAH
jgi:hypothetical protein